MLSEVREGPNQVLTNGAVYAEVVPRSQRAQVQETPAATCIVVENNNPSVRIAIVSYVYLKAVGISIQT